MPFHKPALRNIKPELQWSGLGPHKMKGKVWWDVLAVIAVEQYIGIQNVEEKNYMNSEKYLSPI